MSGRYYEIIVSPPSPTVPGATAKTVNQPLTVNIAKTIGGRAWQSHPGGVVDPAAQNVSFDVMVLPAAVAHGASFVTIEGIGLHDLSEVNNFRPTTDGPWTFELYAGMQGGLPLSARQPAPGLLFGGIVLDAFGNWQGTEMNLSFLVVPGQYSLESPGNLVLDWQKGMDLSSALATMLHQAYPNRILEIDIQSGMVNSHHALHYASSLKQMAEYIAEITKGWGGVTAYPGVSIVVQNNTVMAFDGTNTGKQSPIQISYDSLVGQPTWIGAVTVAITTIMRSDTSVGDVIEMPAGMSEMPGAVFTQATIGNAFLNQKVMFSGKFTVIGVRHCGDFRSDDGAQWVTVIHATAVAPA